MTELWLVRHGQTDWNREGRYQGQADPPLNRAGLAQASELAARLAGTAFAAVYSSDLQRARLTAEVAARAIGLPVTLDTRLREIGLGRWEGMLVSDIQAQYPREWAEREADPWHTAPPGGETAASVAARMQAAAAAMAQAHPRGRVLMVGHGFALATLLCAARSRPLHEVYSLVPDNARPEVVQWMAERST
jgi:probable phosphoglycerate mutase